MRRFIALLFFSQVTHLSPSKAPHESSCINRYVLDGKTSQKATSFSPRRHKERLVAHKNASDQSIETDGE